MYPFVFAFQIDQQKTCPFDGEYTQNAAFILFLLASLFVICLLGVLTLST